MVFHEADEVGAGDGFDGAGGKGFGGEAIESVLVQSGEAEDIARSGDAEEKEPTFGGGCGKFDSAAADDQKVVGGQALAKEGFVGFVMSADADGVEVAQGDAGEGARVL